MLNNLTLKYKDFTYLFIFIQHFKTIKSKKLTKNSFTSYFNHLRLHFYI